MKWLKISWRSSFKEDESGLKLSSKQPKPKLSLWPITEDTDNTVNQSNLETGGRREARENEGERVLIGFGFTSDWLRKCREFF